jgi:hypothetical protein
VFSSSSSSNLPSDSPTISSSTLVSVSSSSQAFSSETSSALLRLPFDPWKHHSTPYHCPFCPPAPTAGCELANVVATSSSTHSIYTTYIPAKNTFHRGELVAYTVTEDCMATGLSTEYYWCQDCTEEQWAEKTAYVGEQMSEGKWAIVWKTGTGERTGTWRAGAGAGWGSSETPTMTRSTEITPLGRAEMTAVSSDSMDGATTLITVLVITETISNVGKFDGTTSSTAIMVADLPFIEVIVSPTLSPFTTILNQGGSFVPTFATNLASVSASFSLDTTAGYLSFLSLNATGVVTTGARFAGPDATTDVAIPTGVLFNSGYVSALRFGMMGSFVVSSIIATVMMTVF